MLILMLLKWLCKTNRYTGSVKLLFGAGFLSYVKKSKKSRFDILDFQYTICLF